MNTTAQNAREIADFADQKIADEELPKVMSMIVREASLGNYSLFMNAVRKQTVKKLLELGYRVHTLSASKCLPNSCFIYWDKK